MSERQRPQGGAVDDRAVRSAAGRRRPDPPVTTVGGPQRARAGVGAAWSCRSGHHVSGRRRLHGADGDVGRQALRRARGPGDPVGGPLHLRVRPQRHRDQACPSAGQRGAAPGHSRSEGRCGTRSPALTVGRGPCHHRRAEPRAQLVTIAPGAGRRQGHQAVRDGGDRDHLDAGRDARRGARRHGFPRVAVGRRPQRCRRGGVGRVEAERDEPASPRHDRPDEVERLVRGQLAPADRRPGRGRRRRDGQLDRGDARNRSDACNRGRAGRRRPDGPGRCRAPGLGERDPNERDREQCDNGQPDRATSAATGGAVERGRIDVDGRCPTQARRPVASDGNDRTFLRQGPDRTSFAAGSRPRDEVAGSWRIRSRRDAADTMAGSDDDRSPRP